MAGRYGSATRIGDRFRPVKILFREPGRVGLAKVNAICGKSAGRRRLPSSNGRDNNRERFAEKGQVSSATRPAQFTKALVRITKLTSCACPVLKGRMHRGHVNELRAAWTWRYLHSQESALLIDHGSANLTKGAVP
jgi:hypothetical protein